MSAQMDTLFDRLKWAFNTQEDSEALVSKKIGIASSAMPEWRRGKSKPSLESVAKIAEYFNISMDWFVFGEEKPQFDRNPVGSPTIKPQTSDSLTDDEKALLEEYRKLPSSSKQKLRVYIDGLNDATESFDAVVKQTSRRRLFL